jgi:hypothetical protein
METLLKFLGFILLAALFVILVAALIALPIMWLVNWLIVPKLIYAIFGVYKLNFWKALGIGLLSGSLFKSVQSTSSKS